MSNGTSVLRKTKIVCTLGPAVASPVMVERLIKAGMNVARINRSHSTFKEHAYYIKLVRDISAKLNRNVAILIDIPGPKYRTGAMKDGSAVLKKGSEVVLTSREVEGDNTVIPLNFPNLYKDVKPGNKVLINDGEMQLKVASIRGKEVVCKVVIGGVLTKGRGVVVPGMKVSKPFITDKLIENLEFAIEQKAEWIALSFVSSSENVADVRDLLKKKNAQIPLISKIEREEAVKNFDTILTVSDGIMVARGDLGVEIDLQKVPLVQKEIIRKSNIAGKTVITATQMLESMINAARPTRAEVSDVANAIMDGTDAIMLSAETSIGKYPLHAVRIMCKIAQETEAKLPYEQMIVQRGEWLETKTDELIAYNACYTAHSLRAAAIVAFTNSGSTARRVSKNRPSVPIIAITSQSVVAVQLNLYWGVQAFRIDTPCSIDELIEKAVELVQKLKLAKSGDSIVITGGTPLGIPGSTNLLKVQRIDNQSAASCNI